MLKFDTTFYTTLNQGFRAVGAGLATIGLAGAGAGIGIVFSGLLIALSRNSALEATLFRFTLLGFALTEAMGLLAVMMAFLILYA